MALITSAEIAAAREMPTGIEAKKIDPIINDAQYRDLKPLLGEKMYMDLVKNPATTANAALLAGGEYTYSGFVYTNPGLKAVLIDFAYARYRFFGADSATPFGFGIKSHQDSKPTGRDRDKETMRFYQQIATEKWGDVERFLNRNSSDYPYWGSDDLRDCPSGHRTFRVSKIN